MLGTSGMRPMTPFGLEGVTDLATAITPRGQERLRQALARDGLLVIRGLELSMDEQIRLCRAFGSIPDSSYENFYVSNARDDGFLGAKELQWHNDVPYLPSPYRVAALHAVDVAPNATSTQFVSGMLAYENMPEALRARVRELNALQVRQRVSERRNRLTDLHAGDLCTVHPVVGRQTGTGRPYLFVNENMTAGIIGLPDAESDALLSELFGYLYAEKTIYEHHWQPGDLVIWDNLAVQHARGKVSEGTRTLQRVTCTEFTYVEQYPADSVGEDLHNATLLVTQA